jgi:hypothetical protein
MPLLNARSANFILTLPKGFIHQDIESKYLPYVKRNPLTYDTVGNLISSGIQSVTFPSISMNEVSQTRMYGKAQDYKSSEQIGDLFTRELTITFKCMDGYINYWIMLENFLKYLDFSTKQQYFDDLYLRCLNQEGHVMTSIRFNQVIMKSLSEINFAYSDNSIDFKTFSVTVKYNKIEMVIERD